MTITRWTSGKILENIELQKVSQVILCIPVALGGTCPSCLHGCAAGLVADCGGEGGRWPSEGEEVVVLACCPLPLSVCCPYPPGSYAYVELAQWP